MKLPALPVVPDYFQVVGWRPYPRDWVSPSFTELDKAEAQYNHMIACGDYNEVELFAVSDGEYKTLRGPEKPQND